MRSSFSHPNPPLPSIFLCPVAYPTSFHSTLFGACAHVCAYTFCSIVRPIAGSLVSVVTRKATFHVTDWLADGERTGTCSQSGGAKLFQHPYLSPSLLLFLAFLLLFMFFFISMVVLLRIWCLYIFVAASLMSFSCNDVINRTYVNYVNCGI